MLQFAWIDTYSLNDSRTLLLVGKEAAKESIVGRLGFETGWQVGKSRITVLGIHGLRVLGLVDAIVDYSHSLVSVQKVGVASVDVHALHADQIRYELVGGVKALTEKVDNNLVETILQLRETLEELLGQELGQNADQLVKDQVDTAQTGVFQTLDLLLDDYFEGSGANKQGRR